jgi:hypothetical protein
MNHGLLPIDKVAKQSGIASSALRYYERCGLIAEGVKIGRPAALPGFGVVSAVGHQGSAGRSGSASPRSPSCSTKFLVRISRGARWRCGEGDPGADRTVAGDAGHRAGLFMSDVLLLSPIRSERRVDAPIDPPRSVVGHLYALLLL